MITMPATIQEAIEIIDSLSLAADKEYIKELLEQRLIEAYREDIYKRSQEAEENYRNDNVKKGDVEELWQDLND